MSLFFGNTLEQEDLVLQCLPKFVLLKKNKALVAGGCH